MIHPDILPTIRKEIQDEIRKKTYDTTIVMFLSARYKIRDTEAIALIKEAKLSMEKQNQ